MPCHPVNPRPETPHAKNPGRDAVPGIFRQMFVDLHEAALPGKTSQLLTRHLEQIRKATLSNCALDTGRIILPWNDDGIDSDPVLPAVECRHLRLDDPAFFRARFM